MKQTLDRVKLAWLGTVVAAALLSGCTTQKNPPPDVMRQRFVPGPPAAAGNRGANWTALHQFSADQPGVLMLMAHVGVGDTFPVQEAEQPKLFDVRVVSGDDDRLRLEVRSEAGVQRLDLRRDGTVWVKIAGHKYSLAYPSVTVGADGQPTTDKAMILVHRFP